MSDNPRNGRLSWLVAGLCAASAAGRAADPAPVLAFILAGQSNMEGHGVVASDAKRNGGRGSLEAVAKTPSAPPLLRQLLRPDGSWVVRDDVWVWYLGRTGGLRPGFGVDEDRIGPELGFGQVVGDALDAPVLLIKLAWGGRSLGKDFRPPSAGGEVGATFLEMVKSAKELLADPGLAWPAVAGRSVRLAGFGWHQGWNDRVNQAFNDEYATNMVCFIRDIRREFGDPSLPFVIAATGQGGSNEVHPRAVSLVRAQEAAAAFFGPGGKVAFVDTRPFWRPKEDSPSGQGYHWNGNAETYHLIGTSMGGAMLRLLGPTRPSNP
jgi:alpha-galactosidase